jgi:RNA polymerase sigma factor (sigma-70 family)
LSQTANAYSQGRQFSLECRGFDMTPDQLFLQNLGHIERVAAHTCRRHHFGREETEDFISSVKCKLIEDNYAILRKFQEKSSPRTYLTVVVNHLFQDHRNHLWGKWRPSAEAERRGSLAIQLERMLVRDGVSFDEACETLWTNHHIEASRQELADLAGTLPHRNPPRRLEGEEVLENHPAQEMPPDEQVLAKEREGRRREISRFPKDALCQLPPEDALLARMRCDFKVSQIARTLHLEQKPLYRRLDGIYKTLRKDLESRGIRPDEIDELLSIPEDDHESLK